MAASDILDIWNDAIGNIGVKTSIAALTEQSAEAAACALRYEGVVNRILRQADWNTSRATVALEDVTAEFAPPARWAYRYEHPDNCLRIWRMENPYGFRWCFPDPPSGFEVALDTRPASFEVPTRYIYSDVAELSVIFTQYSFEPLVGDYDALFDPALREAIAWALAAAIAPSLTGNAQIVAQAKAEAANSLQTALAANSNESAPNRMNDDATESLAVRGLSVDLCRTWRG